MTRSPNGAAVQGCEDVHRAGEPDEGGDFKEASYDFTEPTNQHARARTGAEPCDPDQGHDPDYYAERGPR